MGAPSIDMQEQDLLDAARGGDEHAFRHLVELHRRELHAHCYRMMGSLHDAEDALQDALLRAWRGLPLEGTPLALDVLTLRGSWIAEVMAFRTPEVFPRFGVPAELD